MTVLFLVKVKNANRTYITGLEGEPNHVFHDIQKVSENNSGQVAYEVLLRMLGKIAPQAGHEVKILTNVDSMISHIRNPTAKFPDLNAYKNKLFHYAIQRKFKFKVATINKHDQVFAKAASLTQDYINRAVNTRHTTVHIYQPLSQNIVSKATLIAWEQADIVAFTDGSYDDTKEIGACAAYIWTENNDEFILHDSSYQTDSGQMEMTAIYQVLNHERIPEYSTIEIRTDYLPIITSFESRKLPRKEEHAVLIKEIISVAERKKLRVLLEKVNAHKDVFTNNVVDRLSNTLLTEIRMTYEAIQNTNSYTP